MMVEYNLRQRSYKFSVELIKFLTKVTISKNMLPILNQLLRSGTSVGANIEEADSSSSRKDFRHKTFIAKKEAAEAVYWLKIFIDAKIIDNVDDVEKTRALLDECDQILRILGSILRKV